MRLVFISSVMATSALRMISAVTASARTAASAGAGTRQHDLLSEAVVEEVLRLVALGLGRGRGDEVQHRLDLLSRGRDVGGHRRGGAFIVLLHLVRVLQGVLHDLAQ